LCVIVIGIGVINAVLDESERTESFMLLEPKHKQNFVFTKPPIKTDVSQEDIITAMKIKNHLQQKKHITGRSPINKSMESKWQKENKDQNRSQIRTNEQNILDNCWNKLLNTANGIVSQSVSLSTSKSSNNINSSTGNKSPKMTIQTNKKIGQVKIITTKGKVDKRQLSPLVESKQNFVFGGKEVKKRRKRDERMNRNLSPSTQTKTSCAELKARR